MNCEQKQVACAATASHRASQTDALLSLFGLTSVCLGFKQATEMLPIALLGCFVGFRERLVSERKVGPEDPIIYFRPMFASGLVLAAGAREPYIGQPAAVAADMTSGAFFRASDACDLCTEQGSRFQFLNIHITFISQFSSSLCTSCFV